MMKNQRLASIVGGLSLLLLSLPPSVVNAQALNAKQLRKAQKTADKAFAAGQIDQAVEVYEEILAALPVGDPQRASALFVVALAPLSSGATADDAAAAKAYLEELAKLPRQARRLEVSAVRSLLAQLDTARAETDQRAAELQAKLVASEAEREEAQASNAGESEAADEQLKSLEARLRKARADLKATRAELEKKDEALQKLKDALVGRASGSS